LPGVAFVVEMLMLLEAIENARDDFFVLGEPLQILTHLVDRVGAARKPVYGGGVEIGLGGELAGRGVHGGSIEGEGKEVKEGEEVEEDAEVEECEGLKDGEEV
jgi:hypothetical protein